jgi:predicted component of type VI protein secretion system
MKTPREILLHKHRTAEPQLDAAREKALAILQAQEPARERPGVADFLRELFMLPKPALAGLAATWVVIVALNMASSENSASEPVVMARPSPSVRQALAEQRRFYAELVRSQMPADVPVPRPRSEIQVSVATA